MNTAINTLFLFFAGLMLIGCGYAALILIERLRPLLLKGPPFVASTKESTAIMMKLADIKPTDRVADLGSGDGELVIAAANFHPKEAVGFEIDRFLNATARKRIKKAGMDGIAKIHDGDFWKQDLSGFDLILAFPAPYVMAPLEKKLQSELKPGARVISNT